MEIEVGEFVRTDKGIIDKVESYSSGCNVWHCKKTMCIDECNVTGVYLKDIVKHSKHIIDLIEDTDIVEVEISEEWVIKEDSIRFIIVGQTYVAQEIKEALENGIYKIKTILTHEQYEKNCYRVEE